MAKTYNILITLWHLLHLLPHLGKIGFRFGIIHAWCFIKKDARDFQIRYT